VSRKRRGRGESSIYEKTRRWKTRDGSVREKTQWVAVVSEGHDEKGDVKAGKRRRRRKFIYADSKQGVQEKLRKYLGKHGGFSVTTDRSPFASFVGDFLEDARANLSPNTARSYEQVLRLHVLPHIGRLKLDQIDAVRLRRLYSELRRDGLSASLVARVHVTLRRVLNVAKREERIETNPLDRVDAPTYKRPPARAMTVEQVEALLRAARSHRLEALFVLAVTTGMRQGELFALRWDAVDLKRRTLSVTHSVQEIEGQLERIEPKTDTSRRRIELSKMATDAIERRRLIAKREERQSPYVFPSPTGGLLRKSNFLRRVYFPIRTAAGISDAVPFHALRHTAATMLLLQGVSPRVVQELLGHADVRLTLGTYSHVLPTLQRQAADALDQLLGSGSKSEIVGTRSVQQRAPRIGKPAGT